MDSDDEEERNSGCGGGRGMARPMCTRGTSPPSSVYRKVVQETNYDSPDSMKALTKAAYSYGWVYIGKVAYGFLGTVTFPRPSSLIIDRIYR